MQTTTVYVIHHVPGINRTQAELCDKLDGWINAISTDDIRAELVRFYKDSNEEQVGQWIQGSTIEGAQSKEVARSVMGSTRFRARSNQSARMIARAHQRIMLRSAHQDDLDLSINI